MPYRLTEVREMFEQLIEHVEQAVEAAIEQQQKADGAPAKCQAYWGVRAKGCMLQCDHDGPCVFPLTADDVRRASK